MEIINWKLVEHPMNWVVLFLMIFIVLFAVRVTFGESARERVPGPQLS